MSNYYDEVVAAAIAKVDPTPPPGNTLPNDDPQRVYRVGEDEWAYGAENSNAISSEQYELPDGQPPLVEVSSALPSDTVVGGTPPGGES